MTVKGVLFPESLGFFRLLATMSAEQLCSCLAFRWSLLLFSLALFLLVLWPGLWFLEHPLDGDILIHSSNSYFQRNCIPKHLMGLNKTATKGYIKIADTERNWGILAKKRQISWCGVKVREFWGCQRHFHGVGGGWESVGPAVGRAFGATGPSQAEHSKSTPCF